MTTAAEMDELLGWVLEQIVDDERRALAVCSYSRETTARAGGDNWTVRRSQVRPEDTIEVWATVGSLRPHFTGITLPLLTNLPGYLETFGPARVLAECDAKRTLIAEAIRPYLGGDHLAGRVAWVALRILATPFAGRDGYREEWTP